MVNGYKKYFIAPSILCMNESEYIDAVNATVFKADIFYFHPEIVNSKFSFKFINSSKKNISLTEMQDMHCIEPYFKISTKQKNILQLGIPIQFRINELAKKIREQIANLNHAMWPCLTRSYFLELLFFIVQIKPDFSPVPKLPDEEIEKLILYINANYQNKITINEIEQRFCTNRTTISKKFKKATNESIISYLNKYRINIAAMLLRDTELPINDIIFRVGFNDPSHFNKNFKGNYSMTPSDYREKFNWMLHDGH